jgi:predicted nucleic acid-binding protein
MAEQLLLDASVWLAAYDADDSHHLASATVLPDPRFDLGALELTLLETTNVAVRKWRNAGDAEAISQLIHEAVGTRLYAVDRPVLGALLELAVEHELTAYDAAYAAIARRQNAQLVSLDRDLLDPGLAIHPSALTAG